MIRFVYIQSQFLFETGMSSIAIQAAHPAALTTDYTIQYNNTRWSASNICKTLEIEITNYELHSYSTIEAVTRRIRKYWLLYEITTLKIPFKNSIAHEARSTFILSKSYIRLTAVISDKRPSTIFSDFKN